MIQSWFVFPLNYFLENLPSLFAEVALYLVTGLFCVSTVVTNALPTKTSPQRMAALARATSFNGVSSYHVPGTLQSSRCKISLLLTPSSWGKAIPIFVLRLKTLSNLHRVTELAARWQKEYSNPDLSHSQIDAPKHDLIGTLLVQKNKKT